MSIGRRLPSLNGLRALEAVREAGSVSAAARRLHVSHSAVSHQLRLLEEWVGLPITVRQGRSVALTAAGESLARVVHDSFDAIRHELDLLAMRMERSVSISVLPVIAAEIVLPRLPEFRAAHPDVSLHVSLAQADRPKTPPPDIEVVFRHRSRLVAEEMAFLPGTARPVAAPALVARAGGDPAAVLRAGPLLSDEDSRMWPRWVERAGPGSGGGAAPEMFLEGSFLLQAAALEGLGAALCRTVTIGRALAAGRLVPLSVVAIDEDWVYALRTASPRAIEPEVRLARDWLMSLAGPEPALRRPSS